jgi:glycerol uptake facilitator-like aquaporin
LHILAFRAHFNPNASFALWLTGKLSNRKVIVYVSVQLLASVVGMLIVTAIFPDDHDEFFKAIAIVPADDTYLGKVFATEFFTTFFLVYTAFTVAFEDAEKNKKDNLSVKTLADSRGLTVYASNPQSKTGFAPFSIGFTIFSLSLVGGTSGGAFNQARMFGPALITNRWDYFYLYYIAQILGAACASTVVHNLHRLGLKQDPIHIDETPLSTALLKTKLKMRSKGKVQLQDLQAGLVGEQASSNAC